MSHSFPVTEADWSHLGEKLRPPENVGFVWFFIPETFNSLGKEASLFFFLLFKLFSCKFALDQDNSGKRKTGLNKYC